MPGLQACSSKPAPSRVFLGGISHQKIWDFSFKAIKYSGNASASSLRTTCVSQRPGDSGKRKTQSCLTADACRCRTAPSPNRAKIPEQKLGCSQRGPPEPEYSVGGAGEPGSSPSPSQGRRTALCSQRPSGLAVRSPSPRRRRLTAPHLLRAPAASLVAPRKWHQDGPGPVAGMRSP